MLVLMQEWTLLKLLLTRAKAIMSIFSRFQIILRIIKFEHTVFALPFAMLGAVFGSNGWPSSKQIFWIIIAMAGARSFAMAFNRFADHNIDALNPRTKNRALPAGHLSRLFVKLFIFGSGLSFVVAAAQLNNLCLWLSFPVLLILLFYSYTKRFTRFSHFYLGICLGFSQLGAWIAVRGNIQLTPVLLSLIVVLWTAGFDIIYACQDVDFDRKHSLFSIPEYFGVKGALKISYLLHLCTLCILISLIWVEGLGWISLLGIVLVATLLWYEHHLVKPSDLTKVNAAFFTINGYISILLMLTFGLDKLL